MSRSGQPEPDRERRPVGSGPLVRVLGLEPGDLPRVAPITAAYALTLATIYILKPTRNALFLEQVGVDQLPWVLMLVALAGGLLVAVYGRVAAVARTDRLVQLTLLAMAAMLIGFRALLEIDAAWVFFAFFVWVQLFGLLTTSLVWLWANSAFDPRTARRVFGLIGTGGIAGAIAGGLFTGTFAAELGASNLLFVAAGMVGLVLAALRFAPPATASGPSNEAARPESPTETPSGRLPRLLALNAGVIAFTAVFVDIQFNDIVDRHFEGSDAKAAFFGAFFAWVSGFSLIFQLIATPWLLRRHGVGTAMSILPGALGLGSVVLMTGPVFPLATLPKAADGSFRHSVHKSASELLFLPLPEATKRRTKLFIDTTVDTAATGLGASAILGLTRGAGLSYGQLTIFTLLLIAASLAVIRPVRRAYVDAFRRAIEGRHIDLEKLTVGLDEASVRDLLLPALRSNQPRQVIYALDLLSSARASGVRDAVSPLLDHDHPDVRTRALRILGPDPVTHGPGGRPRLLEDDDLGVRAAALEVWLQTGADAAFDTLQAWLDEDDPRRSGPALAALRALPPDGRRSRLSEPRLDRLEAQAEGHPELGRNLAWALASSREPRFDPRLSRLLVHASAPVVAGAIEGFAESADPAYVPWLLDRLGDRGTRASARRALAAFGAGAVGSLARLVDDREATIAARRAAIRTLADIGDRHATSALVDRLRHGEPALAREVVDALARIRRRNPGQRFPRAAIREALRDRLAEWELIRTSHRGLPEPHTEGTRLFERARREKAVRLRDEVFGLLGLLQDPAATSDAAKRVRSTDPATRGHALEYLENALDPELGRRLLPLLETGDPSRGPSVGEASGPIPTPAEILNAWSRCHDPWLRACALYAAPDIDASVDPALWSSGGELHPLVEEVLSPPARAESA